MLRVLFLLVNFLVVPMDSTQSFVDDFSSLSHRNPPGITVLIHSQLCTPCLYRLIDSSPRRCVITYLNVSARFTVSCFTLAILFDYVLD